MIFPAYVITRSIFELSEIRVKYENLKEVYFDELASPGL